MGVRGLESYMNFPINKVSYHVSIEKLIMENRCKDEDRPVIVVDAMCSLKYIYSGLDFINGGQLKEYEQAVINFVNKFEALGARLVFFFDGPHKEGKRDTWKKRRLGALALMLNLLDNLENGKLVSSFKTDEIICLPVGVREVLFRTVKYVCGCEVRVALKECDEEIARYAKKNKCLAILSQDTDFIIYDSARYYLSMKFLEIQNMSTLVYDRYALAENLKISTAHLPLLATSLGNDIVPNEMLKVFHGKLMHLNLDSRPYFPTLIKKIADFIQCVDPSGDMSDIGHKIVGENSEVFERSISSYDLTSDSKDVGPTEGDENWLKVMARAKELCIKGEIHCSIYQVLESSFFSSALYYEDCRKKDIPLLVEALRNLRKKFYGILLHEKPIPPGSTCHYVEELVMGGPHSFDEEVKVEPWLPSKGVHPGLLELWDRKSKNAEHKRWNLIGDLMNFEEGQFIALKNIEPRLITTVLALIYIINVTENSCLLGWEIDAILAMTLTIKNYSIQKLQFLPSDPVDMRAVRIFTLYSQTVFFFSMIMNACGSPIDIWDHTNFFATDGKLHRHLHLKAKNGSSQLELCENSGTTLDQLKMVRQFIMEAAVKG